MASAAVPIHRLSPDDVIAMVHAGILDEDDRVELVEGILVEMNPLGPQHEDAKEWLTRHFARDDGLAVRVESMFVTDDGYVLPDLQVAATFVRGQLPRTAELVVEIAQSSHARDREKAATYARASVREYWIVDVVAEVVLVHRGPAGDRYATVTEHRDGELEPMLRAAPVALDALFGRG